MSSAVYHPSRVVGVDSFSRHSNNAGLPLPFIPRRRSSMPNSQAIFPFPPPNSIAPPTNDESSNQSSQKPDKMNGGGDPSESRRPVKGLAQYKIQPLLPLQPVEPSRVSTLEFPRQSPLLMAPGSAHALPCSQSITALALDESALTADSAVILSPSPSLDGHIRKKSGEPLRSSLKHKAPASRPSLAVVTGQPSSKSEPATPNHVRSKSVSFAERLDHVKLFFAEQKPIAVSRDGSPTEDTSGTESEAPAPVRKVSSDDERKRLLVMEVVNMPQRWTMDVDVMLEDVTLSKEATICGHVKVKNLAFQKFVAVRFTFDFWQTTSEVSAKYEQPLAHGSFDRFSFVIRLHDILSKIEDKTLFMAVRYAVNGQELWDNNGGHNYKLKFSLPLPSRLQGAIAQIQYASDEEAVADLTQKLERVQSTEALSDAQRFHRRRRSGSTEEDFFFKSSASLSSRYAWATSLKKPWKPAEHHPPPTAQSLSRSVFPWSRKPHHPQKHVVRSQGIDTTRGSPRLGDENLLSETTTRDPPGDTIHHDGSVRRNLFRNHIRGSLDHPSGLTDTGFLGGKVPVFDHLVPPRNKFGEISSGISIAATDNSGGSIPVDLTPVFHMPGEFERISSDDSSTSTTSSTSSSSHPSPVVITAPTTGPPSKEMASIINRLCFYTSSGTATVGCGDDGGVLSVGDGVRDVPDLAVVSEALTASDEVLLRSYSTSSIEDLLHQSQRKTTPVERSESPLKSRSSSCDDFTSLSGSLTPTKTHFRL